MFFAPQTIPMLRFEVFLYPPATPLFPNLISIDRAKLTTQFAEPLNYQIIYKFTCLHLEFFSCVGGGKITLYHNMRGFLDKTCIKGRKYSVFIGTKE